MRTRSLLPLLLSALLVGGAAGQEPAKPLEADPAADQFFVAQLAYQEAIDIKDPKLRKANFEAAALQFSRFLRFHGKHFNVFKVWYYFVVCY